MSCTFAAHYSKYTTGHAIKLSKIASSITNRGETNADYVNYETYLQFPRKLVVKSGELDFDNVIIHRP